MGIKRFRNINVFAYVALLHVIVGHNNSLLRSDLGDEVVQVEPASLVGSTDAYIHRASMNPNLLLRSTPDTEFVLCHHIARSAKSAPSLE